MLSRVVRLQRSGAAIPSINTWHRPLQVSRRFATSPRQSQRTYFQRGSAPQNAPPQKPKKPRRLLFSSIGLVVGFSLSTFFIAGFMPAYLEDCIAELEKINELEAEKDRLESEAMPREEMVMTNLCMAHESQNMFDSTESATWLLGLRSSSLEVAGARVHHVTLPSNFPCEDHYSVGDFVRADGSHIQAMGIFDGHAGQATSLFLKNNLMPFVVNAMVRAQDNDAGLTGLPSGSTFQQAIKDAFTACDDHYMLTAEDLVRSNKPWSQIVTIASLAFSGSCALVSFYSPAERVLRVANVGDSRAVLGRWDPSKKRYVAMPLSYDHTGFNKNEVERLRNAHPGEDMIDPKTGRLFGLVVTRAFGDSRWKWAAETTRAAYERFWGPAPRPKNVIKTPPYLTAEPEITETSIIAEGEHPDFLIMASDGLWDLFDNQDAVHCVELWLQKFGSELKDKRRFGSSKIHFDDSKEPGWIPLAAQTVNALGDPSLSSPTGNEDVFFNQKDGSLQWRATPKHFVVEDAHCGTHLVKNALGGSRRALFEGVVSVKPPLSRNVRDDITVFVAFFKDEKLQTGERRPLLPGIPPRF